MDDLMVNSSPTWAAYCALLDYHLVVIDKISGVRPVGIRERLCRSLAKLIMRTAEYQAKTA